MAESLKNNRDSRLALERAALAVHTKFGRGHRTITRLFELLLWPLARVLRPTRFSELREVQKILVLEQGHLGDVILLTPFMRALRRQFPNAHIALLGRPGLRNLLEAQNLVNELIPIEIPWTAGLPRWRVYNPFSLISLKYLREVFRLRRRDFDLAFVAGLGDIRHNFALLLAGARRRVAYGFAGGGVFLTDVVKPDLSRVHHADLSLHLLEQLGITVLPRKELLSLAPEEAEFGHDFLVRNDIDDSDLVVGIHPRAGAAIKEWGEDRFQSVAEQIVSKFGAKVIWFLDPGQPPARPTGDKSNIIRVALPLRQFLAVLSCCHALVCNDSGPMHMAAGLGVRVVAIFGPELPDWFGPLGAGHQIVIREGMWCRPCWRKCRFGEPYCLRLIGVEQVMEAVSEAVGRLARERDVAQARW
jgi:ADP-heptose:LPS heptosyltransferase